MRIDADTSQLGFGAGDLLLLCTDGLHGKVSKSQIEEILKEAADPSRLQIALWKQHSLQEARTT